MSPDVGVLIAESIPSYGIYQKVGNRLRSKMFFEQSLGSNSMPHWRLSDKQSEENSLDSTCINPAYRRLIIFMTST
jgi:hypothetical protein